MTTAKQILIEVSEKHSVSVEEMKSPRHTRNLSRARDEAIYKIRVLLGKSYPWIGDFLNRHHTSVSRAFDRHNSQSPTPRQEHARHTHLSQSDDTRPVDFANRDSAGRRVLEKERMK